MAPMSKLGEDSLRKRDPTTQKWRPLCRCERASTHLVRVTVCLSGSGCCVIWYVSPLTVFDWCSECWDWIIWENRGSNQGNHRRRLCVD
jgi:hypothetical protein